MAGFDFLPFLFCFIVNFAFALRLRISYSGISVLWPFSCPFPRLVSNITPLTPTQCMQSGIKESRILLVLHPSDNSGALPSSTLSFSPCSAMSYDDSLGLLLPCLGRPQQPQLRMRASRGHGTSCLYAVTNTNERHKWKGPSR